ncbi:4'-phosphopantetheinyl transferase family protein [Primorskyibacter flagellatus]|uniref:4'-phosphopantetheinyl transferase family protein n=1 Tax=Primorskyibacter flagellatus TaxID=1387277 RepID=UPI000A007F13|nr:4'-phosphopantetheinyl transferase superfamily protein [Primorskyibacter flagellatus]
MTDLPALAAALRACVGPGIGVGVTDPRGMSAPLFAEEAEATRKMVEKRHREFAAGRAAARAAMAELSLPPVAIPMGADRAPIWPEGLCGSISHCAGAAVAVVAPLDRAATLGIDIEDDTPLDADLWPDILTPQEVDWLMCQPEPTRGRHAKAIFSAKEAVYKAQYPLTGRVLGFDAVFLTPNSTEFQAEFLLDPPAVSKMITVHALRTETLIASFAFLSRSMACCIASNESPPLSSCYSCPPAD